jgi:hypothetical protein
MQGDKNIRTHALVPASSLLICGCCTGVIAQLHFVEVGEVLLVSGCAAEVAFAAVMCDGPV